MCVYIVINVYLYKYINMYNLYQYIYNIILHIRIHIIYIIIYKHIQRKLMQKTSNQITLTITTKQDFFFPFPANSKIKLKCTQILLHLNKKFGQVNDYKINLK